MKNVRFEMVLVVCVLLNPIFTYAQEVDPSLVDPPEAAASPRPVVKPTPVLSRSVTPRVADAELAGSVSPTHFSAVVSLMRFEDDRKKMKKAEGVSNSKEDQVVRALETANPVLAQDLENEVINIFEIKPGQDFYRSREEQKIVIAFLKAVTAEIVDRLPPAELPSFLKVVCLQPWRNYVLLNLSV